MIMQCKKNILTVGVASVLLAGLLPLNAYAHRAWLLPSATQVEGREPWVTVDAAVSENLFDFDTTALKLDGLAITGPDGAPVQPENPFTGHLRSSFDLKLAQPGTYKISIVADSVMASYKQNGETRRWRGTVEAFAKEIPADAEQLHSVRLHQRMETFVTSGKRSDVTFKTTGVGLELVPITHPNDMLAGQKASYRFLLDGKPVAGLPISVVPGGVRYRGVLKEIRADTDAKGEFSITWPEAGMYWVGASYPPRTQPSGAAQQAPAKVQPTRRISYGGTLEVLPQ